ncbi:hypothetical protein HDU80_000334 [Chytriomyces hyalinus]|nr:hypothetical protein HDU80_000334 [Chytriomyces hyalinus]
MLTSYPILFATTRTPSIHHDGCNVAIMIAIVGIVFLYFLNFVPLSNIAAHAMNFTRSELTRTITYVTPAILSVLTLGVGIWIPLFVVFVELPSKGRPRTLKNVFTVANSLLIAMQLFTAAYLVCITWFSLAYSSEAAMVCATFTFSVAQTCYLFFSWKRSEDLLVVHSPPERIKIFRRLLYATPITASLPGICAIVFGMSTFRATIIYFIAFTVQGNISLCLDLLFAYTFYKQVRTQAVNSKSVGIKVNAKFGIIATMGLLTCFFVLNASAGFVVSGVLYYCMPENHLPAAIFWAAKDVLLFGVSVCLAAMKYRLALDGTITNASVKSTVSGGTGGWGGGGGDVSLKRGVEDSFTASTKRGKAVSEHVKTLA